MYKIPKKKCRLREQPYKNKAYLSWLHNHGLSCMICGNTQIELHHIDQGSKGRADNRCVPLCPEHHRGKYSPHGADKREFEEKYMHRMEYLCADLFEEFEAESCE